MIGSHVAVDHILFVVLCVVSPLLDWLWFYPRFRSAVAANEPGARPRFYIFALLYPWGATLCVVALWIVRGRAWAALNLSPSTPFRLGIGLALAAAYVALMWIQRRQLVARPERLARLRKSFGSAEALLPHTRGELKGFTAVSITAGICEELIYRGFVFWYLSVWTGSIIALVLSSILFGFAHVYLGFSHVIKTSIVGLVFAIIVYASGSLWPAIIIHAVMDMVAGDLAFHAFSAPALPTTDTSPGASAPA